MSVPHRPPPTVLSQPSGGLHQLRAPAPGGPQRNAVQRQLSSPALLGGNSSQGGSLSVCSGMSLQASPAGTLNFLQSLPTVPVVPPNSATGSSSASVAATGHSTPTTGFVQRSVTPSRAATQASLAQVPLQALPTSGKTGLDGTSDLASQAKAPSRGASGAMSQAATPQLPLPLSLSGGLGAKVLAPPSSAAVAPTASAVPTAATSSFQVSSLTPPVRTQQSLTPPAASVAAQTLATVPQQPASTRSLTPPVRTPQSLTPPAAAPSQISASAMATATMPTAAVLPPAPTHSPYRGQSSSATSLTQSAATPASSSSPSRVPPEVPQRSGWHHRIEEVDEDYLAPLQDSTFPRAVSGAMAVVPESDTDQGALSMRSIGSAHSGRLSTSSTSGVQGVARCALCHSLLHLFAGRSRIQAFAAASSLPRPCQNLVDRLLALQCTEADQVASASSLCRFHSVHKARYELWTRMHTKVRRYSAGSGGIKPEALAKAAHIGEDLAQMEQQVEQAGPAYIEVIGQYVKQLQQDVRRSVASIYAAKAQDFIESCQSSVDEVNDAIDKKIDERRAQLHSNLSKFEEKRRDDYWRKQQRDARQKSSAAAEGCRNLQTWKRGGYTETMKELAAMEQANRCAKAKAADMQVATMVERERALKEKELDVWLAKMEQLRQLQHDQANRDRSRIFARVDRTLQKCDDDFVIEFRQISGRFQQHVNRVMHMLERVRRGQSVRLKAMDSFSRSDARMAELEPFAYSVLRTEVAAQGGACLDLDSPTQNCAGMRQAIADEATGGAGGGPGSFRVGEGSNSTFTVDISEFAEFLGARFPNLRTAFASIDLTGSGRVACFELQTWMMLHSFQGEARLIHKELDRQGHGRVGLDSLRALAGDFLQGGLRCGRPAGTVGAAVLAHFFNIGCGGSRERGSVEAFFSASRCARRILAFVYRGAVCPVSPSTGGTPERLETSLTQLLSAASSVLETPNGVGPCSKSAADEARALAAKSREEQHSMTEIGRWAKSLVEAGTSERRSHMRCGVSKATPAQPLAPSPPRPRSTTPVRRESSCTSTCAKEAEQEWMSALRKQGADEGRPRRHTAEPSRRGAPPPKIHVKTLLDEVTGSVTQSSRMRGAMRSSSAPRERKTGAVQRQGRSQSPSRSLSSRRSRPTSASRSRPTSASRSRPTSATSARADDEPYPLRTSLRAKSAERRGIRVGLGETAAGLEREERAVSAQRSVSARRSDSADARRRGASASKEASSCESAPELAPDNYGSMKLRQVSPSLSKESSSPSPQKSQQVTEAPRRTSSVQLPSGQQLLSLGTATTLVRTSAAPPALAVVAPTASASGVRRLARASSSPALTGAESPVAPLGYYAPPMSVPLAGSGRFVPTQLTLKTVPALTGYL